MRNHVVVLAIGLAVCCGWACRSITAPRATSADPSEIAPALLRAFNNLDSAELRGLLAEDATAFLPFASSGARLDGREAIVHAIEPMFAAERARSSHGAPYLALTAKALKVQRLGVAAAIVSFDVGSQQVFSRRTLVVQAIGGRWQIVHLHASNIRPDAAPANAH